MKLDTSSLKPLSVALRKAMAYHVLLSFMLIMGVLMYVALSIQSVFSTPVDSAYEQEQLMKNTKTSFDKNTILQIESLRTSSDTSAVQLPEGRINPFKE